MTASTTSATAVTSNTSDESLYTCNACAIAFHTAEEQRAHYRSDLHGYNMKRRIAELPPLSTEEYNSKVLERRAEIAQAENPQDWNCIACRKSYSTENAYISHLGSKRHRENEATPMFQRASKSTTNATSVAADALDIPEDADEETVNNIIDARISAAENQLNDTTCLFCRAASTDATNNLQHMQSAHSFFVPSSEHLVDLAGLLKLLAGQIAVAHICIFCAREFRTPEAARKHMLDKAHCKVPFESKGDRRALANFYSFPASGSGEPIPGVAFSAVDDDADANAAPPADSSDELDSDGGVDSDEPFELRIAGGQRIGHRSLARYYKQRLVPLPKAPENPHDGRVLMKALTSDKSSALVPTGGGFGAFGKGLQVVKARNHGEAVEAGRHVSEFRDQKRREAFRTRVAFIANHQKHFLDPILGHRGS